MIYDAIDDDDHKAFISFECLINYVWSKCLCSFSGTIEMKRNAANDMMTWTDGDIEIVQYGNMAVVIDDTE